MSFVLEVGARLFARRTGQVYHCTIIGRKRACHHCGTRHPPQLLADFIGAAGTIGLPRPALAAYGLTAEGQRNP